jgi:hypothetical protein
MVRRWRWRRVARTCVATLCLAAVCAACAAVEAGHAPTEEDGKALAKLLSDVQQVRALLQASPPPKKKKIEGELTAAQRTQLLSLWGPHVDHDLALASYQERFLDNWRRAGDVDDQTRALSMGVVAMAARVASNLDFLEAALSSEAAEVAMDESSPEHGLTSGHLQRILLDTAKIHSQLKLSLGVQELRRRLTDFRGKKRAKDQPFVAVQDQGLLMAEEVDRRYGAVAPKLMARAIGQVAGSQLKTLSSTLVTNIALWLGDTRLRGSGKSLISAAQIDWLAPQAQPGDVLVERRNWYLSNLGLPGFWPHAEFYVGTAAELSAALDKDPTVIAVYGAAGLTGWLQANTPTAWQFYVGLAADGKPHRILEAISDGVVFSSLNEAAQADYVGVLRPRLTALERARAIAKAFAQIGKPYDFDFDFLTLDTLVCSEVVYQAYLPQSAVQTGLLLPLTEVMGRKTLPPNDIVRVFDQQFGTDAQQFDFVAFLDGREATKNAVFGTVDDLRASWRRPKWDLSQQ